MLMRWFGLEVVGFRGGGMILDPPWIFLLPVTMRMTPILHITPQLVLPVNFLSGKSCLVTLINLINDLHGQVLIAASLTPVVVAQPSINSLDLLFVIAMPSFKNRGTFSHVLPPAPFAGSKIYYKAAITVQHLLDGVGSSSVSACECFPLFNNRTGNPAPRTFEAPSQIPCIFFLYFLSE